MSHIFGQVGITSITDVADASKTLDINLTGALSDTRTLLNLSQTANRTWVIPDTSSTFLGTDASQTVTNKTITSNTNTVTAGRLRTTGADIIISGSAPPTSGQVFTAISATQAGWETPSGGGGGGTLPLSFSVSADDPISTTSSSLVVASNMTITPPAGTYSVSWTNANIETSNNFSFCAFQLRLDGTAVSPLMNIQRAFSDYATSITVLATVTTNGTQAIEGFWSSGSGTLSMSGRTINLIQVDGSNLIGVPGNLPFSTTISNSNNVSTTSSAYVLIPGMTVTPPAGRYSVFFAGASVQANTNNAQARFRIYAGGVAIGPISIFRRGTEGILTSMTSIASVTVNGSQAIEVRWSRTAGTINVSGKSLQIIQVAP